MFIQYLNYYAARKYNFEAGVIIIVRFLFNRHGEFCEKNIVVAVKTALDYRLYFFYVNNLKAFGILLCYF